ncbi:MAG: AraC family transcriptional regulator [Verrucomicrobia bacterium]|nr:AraC family transcriptional regulator [Verrucomicrobiota bacterium]
MDDKQFALRFQSDFLARADIGIQLAWLFESLAMVAFFAKDHQYRFVRMNARCLEIMGCEHEWQVLGKTDDHFHTREIAAAFQLDDRQVMETGESRLRYLQMVPNAKGPLRWYLVNKMPIHDNQGKVCGIAGAMYETHELAGPLQSFHRLEPALRHIHEHFKEPFQLQDLARLVNLSERQFHRLFRQILGERPLHYITRQRIHGSCELLITTDAPVASIALDCGFYDQSAFTRAFREFMGTTPSDYRNQHAAGGQTNPAP